jgi:quercetin dioxygenase-like cupin family protein
MAHTNRPARSDHQSARAAAGSNGDVAAMIAAEVNEGGPPSPTPCDTPVEVADHCSGKQPTRSEQSIPVEACPAPDRVLHVPLGRALGAARSTTLLKSAGLELIRLVVPAGKEIPPHRAPGEIVVQCVEGHVAFHHDGRSIELCPGDVLHLCANEMHSLKGITDSSVLVTRLRLHADELPETLATARA